MKKSGYFFYGMLFLVLYSCSDEPSEIGSGFFQDGNIDIVSYDTLTLEVSTVAFDSFTTSSPLRMLAGYHVDDDLGNIVAMPYFQVTPGEIGTLTHTTYARATLVLRFDGYSYYDTISTATLNVHRVLEDIEPEEGYHYNTSRFEYDPAPLGSLSFQPRPNLTDSVEIPLSDNLGQHLFDLAERSAEEISSSSNFLKYFKGLAVVASTGASSAVVGFSKDADLRVYYLDRSETPAVERYFALKTGDNQRFNHLRTDRGGTNLSVLEGQDEVRSAITDNKAYFQGGSGLGIRVGIPYLRNILIDNPDVVVLEAELELSPVPRSNAGNAPAPETLVMSVINGNNEVISSSDNQDMVRLEEDDYLGRDTRYKVSIHDFVRQQLALQEFNRNALLFTADDEYFRSSVHRLYTGDHNGERPMKLTLYYLRVKNKNQN